MKALLYLLLHGHFFHCTGSSRLDVSIAVTLLIQKMHTIDLDLLWRYVVFAGRPARGLSVLAFSLACCLKNLEGYFPIILYKVVEPAQNVRRACTIQRGYLFKGIRQFEIASCKRADFAKPLVIRAHKTETLLIKRDHKI